MKQREGILKQGSFHNYTKTNKNTNFKYNLKNKIRILIDLYDFFC